MYLWVRVFVGCVCLWVTNLKPVRFLLMILLPIISTVGTICYTQSRDIHCNTLQHIASQRNSVQHSHYAQTEDILCNRLQHTPTHCNHCNTLQHSNYAHMQEIFCNTLQHTVQLTASHYNTLQRTAPHCNAATTRNILATYCNILQHAATHCNTLQHSHYRQMEEILEIEPGATSKQVWVCWVKSRHAHNWWLL